MGNHIYRLFFVLLVKLNRKHIKTVGENMTSLQQIHENAIEHTKVKIEEDITSYLETKEELPSYEQYILDRGHYLQQIWINVWLNKVTNDVARKNKKIFLAELGFEVEGVDRKIINNVFRNEMRDYHPFAVIQWLNEKYASNENDWKQKHEQAREEYVAKEHERKRQELRENFQKEINKLAHSILESDKHILFLYTRHFVAKQLIHDFKQNIKYEAVDTYRLEEILVESGVFDAKDYVSLSDFYEELTGSVHQTFHRGQQIFEYETYFYDYERKVTDYLFSFIAPYLLKQIPEETLQQYEKACEEPLSERELRKGIANAIYVLVHDYLEKLNEEFVSDLVELAGVPFEIQKHEAIYEADTEERERKIEEALAEIKRKQEEEARMLEDIFGREYQPKVGRTQKYVLHIGETNTGKTYQALQRMQQAESGIYLAPLRLLALEVYDTLNNEGVPCSLKTGEEEKMMPGARHISCTVEMFHEKDFYEVVVIDEAQMLADQDRGFSWYKAITKANANEVHIIGSYNIKKMILQLLGNANVELNEYDRDIPLQVEAKPFQLSHTKKGDAIVCFSRRRVLETASTIQNNGFAVSMIYGSMPPETRKKQMQQFIEGKTQVIVSTDAIGMGLNLPIRRIVFLENEKFDGTKRRTLTSQEVKQIAGRAGRKGIYDIGRVAFTDNIHRMAALLEKEDKHVQSFAIAPTSSILERFQKYSHQLGDFFELWEKFDSPEGTEKASLAEEQYLYEIIRDTAIEARLSILDLYGFLHLPFSTKEPVLVNQWRDTLYAVVEGRELPEPFMKKDNLEESELSYKAIGLHLLFLYRLDKRTEALYWERIRETFSDEVHERLQTDIKVMRKSCKKCGKTLDAKYKYEVCDGCHYSRIRKKHKNYYHK